MKHESSESILLLKCFEKAISELGPSSQGSKMVDERTLDVTSNTLGLVCYHGNIKYGGTTSTSSKEGWGAGPPLDPPLLSQFLD